MNQWVAACTLLGLVFVGCTGSGPSGPNETIEKRIVQKPVVQEAPVAERAAVSTEKVFLGVPDLLAGIPGEGPITAAEIREWLDDAARHAPLEIELPMWLKPGAGQVKDLKDNPMTRAKIELGRQLFFDKRLSADNTISCASCHEPEKGYTVDIPFAVGINGQRGRRNPPTLLNRVMLSLGHDQQFWDGRSVSVEDALLHALSDPTEMAASPEATVRKLKGSEVYRLQFDRIYGEVTWDGVGNAIGCFVRNLVTGPAPYDYHVRKTNRSPKRSPSPSAKAQKWNTLVLISCPFLISGIRSAAPM